MVKRSITLVFLLSACPALAMDLAREQLAPLYDSAVQSESVQHSSSRQSHVPCLFKLPDSIAATARCSTTKFPIDYATPDNSQTISLHAVTIPGTLDSTTATILLDGGPGGSGNAVLRLLADTEFSQKLQALGDIVVLAQRGTRFSSQPLNCTRSHKACLQKLQQTDNISSFTTENSAHDLIRFTNNQGYSDIRIVGYSYGTRLALQVAQLAPEKVTALALDSVIPLNTNHQDLRGIDNALTTLDRECSKSEACKAHVSDSVIENFFTSLAALDDKPLVIPGSFGSIKLTPQVFLERVVNGLQAGATLKYMPRFISEISNSKPGLISRDLLNGPGIAISNGDLAVGLLMAVNCSDIVNVNDNRISQTVENFQRNISSTSATTGLKILGKLLTDSVIEQGTRCSTLLGSRAPVLASAMDSHSAFTGPSLLISGELDPIAPVENAALVQLQLGQTSRSILFPGISHAVAFESKCARSLIASFLTDSDTTLDLDCIGNPEIDFPSGNGFVVQR